MALVKYIKDNIPDKTIGFIGDDRDYFINVASILTGKRFFQYNENKIYDDIDIVITNIKQEDVISKLNRKFKVLTYGAEGIKLLPITSKPIEIRSTDSEILDLLEGETFYNIFMNFKGSKEEFKKANIIYLENKEDEYIYFPTRSNNYLITDVSLYSTANQSQSVSTAELLLNYFNKDELKSLSLIEASSCIGGNTWGFGEYIDNTTAVEIDDVNYKALVHNMNKLNKNIKTIKDNFIKVKDTGYWDIIFYDPPWGGVDYKDNPRVGYSYNNKFYGLDILASKSFYKNPPKLIMFRIPMKSEIETSDYKYKDTIIFKDKSPIYKVVILSDIKPKEEIKEVVVERINYKDIKTTNTPPFEELYSVPEKPEEFDPSNKEEKTINNLIGWKPFKPYLKKEDIPIFKSGHWGQRKLLLTEILFFTLHGKPNTTVIYAGAAPSDHMLFLSKMFPTYHFVLVDPERWNRDFGKVHYQLNYNNFPEYQKGSLVIVKINPEDNINYGGPYKIKSKEKNGSFTLELLSNSKIIKKGVFITEMKPYGDVNFVEPLYYKINDKIDVYHGYFTDKLAIKLGKQYANTNVLFLSDIRPTNIEGVSSTLEERDTIVIQNMEMQKRWYLLINEERRKVGKDNVWAMFKFKATFGISTSKYLKGDLYYQPWAPLKSPELRLITNSEEIREYSNDWLEQHLTWFNEVRRNILNVPRDKRLNGVLDNQYEYDILKMYIDKFKPEDKDVYNWMGEISAQLGDRDRNKEGLFQYEEGYEPDEWRKEKWINSLLTKMQKYTQ